MKELHQKILQEIKSKNIQFVRFIWCDNAGVIRAKAVHTNLF
ncbi:MAG: hypothetical protein UR68_C0013G0012 [Candidatus Roizmanbacteria bacterium GW2011_GWA2_35_19]|uniref:Glutamine synthetase n=2 Tax=Candidatus Roizmaniibacteriota TaxID=1752723 RepID=A0A0G0BTE7_9BACT|nr:MAG: hypothetical protein UR63_C0020G0014 [Candidatus Roizmanbacteria bacterium GW2011_GWC2_35_12]KKP72699.1 MAG: hypothetical protein UR68_C0013G0012 [Candidatus Roizmanbacteria bacterium GW2011_GWA2_35_19]